MLWSIVALLHFVANGANASSAVVVAAKPIASAPGDGYISVARMDLLCGKVFIHAGFLCDVTWESGAIGKFVSPGNVTQQLQALPASFEQYSQRVNATSSDFVWFSGINTPLSPELARNRRYTWLPASCAQGVFSSQPLAVGNKIKPPVTVVRLKPPSTNTPPPS